MSLQLLVILVPVIFGLMGFAIDLGRLWMIRGELNQAANAMALAAAAQMAGPTASGLDNMTNAAQLALDPALGNKFNFGSTVIPFDPNSIACFGSVSAAIANDTSGTSDCGSAAAVQVSLSASAPLLFWSLMPGGESRTTQVASYAVAGMSAPLCTACGIEPYAIAALDSGDTANFGFGDPTAGTIYTFAFSCTGTPAVTTLAGASAVMPYVLINRYDTNSSLDEAHQLFRAGAGGLVSSQSPNPTGSTIPIACAGVNDGAEALWATAVPVPCSTTAPASVTIALCGLDARFEDPSVQPVCAPFSDISPLFTADSDIANGTDAYSSYQGNGRRVITVAVVDALAANAAGTMTVLGFRQFLVEPNQGIATLTPADPNGRFNAMYIGSPKPVAQGWFDDRYGLACTQGSFSGPGKVVLFQ